MSKLCNYTICPDENELALFIEGNLSGERLERVKQHLNYCRDCNETVRLAMELNLLDAAVNVEPTNNQDKKREHRDTSKLIAGAALSGTIIEMLTQGSHHIPMVAENNLQNHERFDQHDDSIKETEHSSDMSTTNQKVEGQFGEEASFEVSKDIYQVYKDTCAIRSQQLVLNDFGIPITQDELIAEATKNGWYVKGVVTKPHDVGNLLESHGIAINKVEEANIYNLVGELAQGHRVIVAVDANELHHNGFIQDMKDILLRESPNHALLVAGIDTSDLNNIQVILKDPGTGDVAKAYPIAQFIDAWDDSENLMVATKDSVPLSHNPEMVNFDYQTGHIDEIGNMSYDFFVQHVLPYSQTLINEEIKHSIFHDFIDQTYHFPSTEMSIQQEDHLASNVHPFLTQDSINPENWITENNPFHDGHLDNLLGQGGHHNDHHDSGDDQDSIINDLLDI
jgi:hypothetical protein